MFKRFDINDLYLAHVLIIYPESTETSRLFSGTTSLGYLTILKKSGENYIDLQDMSRIVSTTRDPKKTSYVIYNKEPLSKHYTQEGKKKIAFTRKNAVNIGKEHYSALLNNKEKQIKCK